MRIIEIAALSNGAHRNQEYHGEIPSHWGATAFALDVSAFENFPFGTPTVEEVNGVMTVTAWEAGEIPEPKPIEEEPTEVEQLRADVDYIAIMTGVEL